MDRTPTWIVACSMACVLLVACGPPHPESTADVEIVRVDRLPAAPDDPAWASVPFHGAAMLPQDMVEPRRLEPWAPNLRVQALTDGREVAFRLAWDDGSADDLPGPSRFSDACAVQLPAKVAPDVPAPQMGETDRPVEIIYWRASWQASVDGREDRITSIYPGATVDHYPFEAPSLEPGSEAQVALARQYAPARALAHPMEGPRERSVEDLVAEGPGTLAPAARSVSHGRGARRPSGWAVVVVRPLPEGLDGGERSQVAFAVWDGARDDVGARKMRSGWIGLFLRGEG